MPQKINLNVPPYNDDFDSSKDFYKVIFRPGYSIQSRELTNLQSILQNQIESFGRNRFKQGDMVIPGEVGFNNQVNYVKLSSVSEIAETINGNIQFRKYDIKKLVGETIQGLSSGVTATVIAAEYGNESEADTIFVKYTNSGNSGNESTFRQGENLESPDIINSPVLVVGTDGSVLPTSIIRFDGETDEVLPQISSPAMGYASAVKVEEGVYFVNGYFVRNSEQLLIVDKYYQRPTAQIGFKIQEDLVSPEEDPSLYDNAKGFSNYSAPGAHRLRISLDLFKYAIDEQVDNNFIRLITIKNGSIQNVVNSANYSLIEETLARRTYDESGDYIVEDFPIETREFYQRNGNKGLYPLREDGTVGPEPREEDRFTPQQASAKFVAGVGRGKAYVKGYEIVKKETKYFPIDKARDTLSKLDTRVKIRSIPSYNITNVYSSISLNSEGTDITAYPTIYHNLVYNDGSVGTSNTEPSTSLKQTRDRRGEVFTTDDGIKTIYLQLGPAQALPSPTSFPGNGTNNVFGTEQKLWYVKTWSLASGLNNTVESVEVLSYSIVVRDDILDISTGAQFVELTVKGNKKDLDLLFKEYDSEDIRDTLGQTKNYRKKLFLTRTDAEQNIDWYGSIVDYNETITPIIGVSKPKDFSFIRRGDGFSQDRDIILSKGRMPGGTEIYNGIFKFSYFNPVYFTKIIVDTPVPVTGFESGEYITGLTSGAYGIIENTQLGSYTVENGNTIFVKSLYGQFLPGETIIDESGRSLRIARENTISHFIVIGRGSGYDESTSLVKINNQVIPRSTLTISTTDSANLFKINILNRNLLSTEYLYPPTVEVGGTNAGPGTGAIITPVLYRNTVTSYTDKDVKSLHSTFGTNYKFTCDIESTNDQYYETKRVTEFNFIGNRGYKYLECQGFSGDATLDLKQGDIIQFNNASNVSVKTIVQYATKPQGLLRSRIYLDSALDDNVNTTIIKISPKIENPGGSLLIPTGSNYVSSLVSSPEDSQIKYYSRRDFVVSASSSGGIVTFRADLQYGTQRFIEFTEQNFLLTVLSDGGSTTVNPGDILYVRPEWVTVNNQTDVSGLIAGTVTLDIPATYFGTVSNYANLKLKLTATLENTKVTPRLKTIVKNKRIIINSPGDKIVLLRGQDYDSGDPTELTYSDVVKVHYAYEGSLSSTPEIDDAGNLISGTDVTSRFNFDDGQRDTFYDVSRLVIKPGFTAPRGILVVSFDYFEHSQGDFCTVDSYVHESGVSYEQIPTFNSSQGIVSLRDVIDFRPKVDTTTIISGYQNNSILSQNNYVSFNGSGGITSSTPATQNDLLYTIEFDLKQFLDRIDSIALNKRGEFVVIKGNPSLNPVKPDELQDAITLYHLYIPSHTDSVDDIKITPVNNKRYTMKDIGKLEKRIERLEYYTQLSILEQQALNMQIKDDIGFDRFKSGFIVDSFENHGIGNLLSLDYKCSIDSQQSVLRSPSVEDSVELIELYTTETERNGSNYKKTGHIVSLPYNKLQFISNSFATSTINPNPFVVVQYTGDAKLEPSIDQWFDQKERPVILNNDGSIYSIFYARSDTRDALSSIFNSYIINWVGTNRAFFNTTSLTTLSSVSSSSTVSSASVSSSSNVSPQNNELSRGSSSTTVNGNNVVTSLHFYARSRVVYYNLSRMRPNTTLYAFVEEQNVGRWIAPDSYYTGIPGNSTSSFGSPIITDGNGNASGLIIIPAGSPPISGSIWTGDINTISYDTSYQEINLTTGTKTFTFTSSSTGSKDSTVSTFTEVNYYVTGILPNSTSSILSTIPPILKTNEGVQTASNSVSGTASAVKPNPLSQSFRIEGYDGGLFVTDLDLFFSQKSNTIPIRVYLTNVDSGIPGKYIVPGSEVTKLPYTYLKVYTNGTLTVTNGENATGTVSGASGPIASVIDRNGTSLVPNTAGQFTLQNNQVYTLVLSNHNGNSFRENEILTIPSLQAFNTTNATSLSVTIAKNSGRIGSIRVTNLGSNYESATLTIESPSLPGGATATATAFVSNGEVYDCQLTTGGSGYTSVPSVIINGTGIGNVGAEITAELIIDTPAVRMGVATSPSGTATTPTKFTFDHPIYLQNDTEYAFMVETDSTDYRLWSSILGQTDVITSSIVNTQPLLGSVFKSQNTDNWTEDIFEDLKFNLYRAQFNTSTPGTLYLVNKPLGYEKLDANPFETDSSQDSTATSKLFKSNNKIINVYHRNHGFEDEGHSFVSFRNSTSFAGINSSVINSKLFTIHNCGTNFYTISTDERAGSSINAGGNQVYASYNRKFEKVYAQVSYLNFASTILTSQVKTTNIIPIDGNVTTYSSYDQSSFENTFLNQEQFYTNQKILCSNVNSLKNNISHSLIYKIDFSTNVDHLSPVVDLRVCSAKLINNHIEKASGLENRYGRRNQVLKFYPVYSFQVSGLSGNIPQIGETVTGSASQAQGVVVAWDSTAARLYVKMRTIDTPFLPADPLSFSLSTSIVGASVSPLGVSEYVFNFSPNTEVVAMYPSNNALYTNKINGTIVSWDSGNKLLTVSNNKNPISNNYTAAADVGTGFARVSVSSQLPDIFRPKDIISYQGIMTGQEKFAEIYQVSYETGVLYVSELGANNSSSIAKYVTKEVVLETLSTSLDVRLTANIFERDDIKVFYKFKQANSEFNFDTLNWNAFNVTGISDTEVIPSVENNISGYFESQQSYKEYKYSVNNLPEFSSFAIKIVMTTSNPCYPPKIQDLRAVASF